MQTTLTLYPRFEEPIELVIRYVPELDGKECEGWWNIDTNQIALSWKMYSDFQKIGLQSEKRKFFDTLKKVSSQQIS